MLKFHHIVLRKFIVIFSVLFFIVGSLVYYWTKDFYLTQTKNSLLQNIEIISFHINDKENLDALAQKVKTSLSLRLTFINEKGTVIAESHKDKFKMDNHKYRTEILQANEEDYGYIIRHSNTIDKDLLYIAKKFTHKEKTLFIRLAQELKGINEHLFFLGLKIFGVLALFFIAIFFITFKMSKEIEKETLKIVSFLTSLTKKNKSNYIHSNLSLEFSKITNLLTKVSQILIKKEKQKAKFTTKLQVSNQQKDDIISAISHEFKNPIAVINGYAQTLLDDQEIHPNIRNKFLTKIHANGVKLSSLIDTLRLSIKLDNGKQSIEFSHVSVYKIVEDIVDTMKINYPRRIIHITGDPIISVKADASLFGVVVSNLVENALKYSEDEISIHFDDSHLSVKDTGIGISKTDVENITNKFYRVHENSWNNSLGLGLFIVSNILKLHNFSLSIISKEN
ncbi:sensor histidine kinase, partial [Sulfurimonas sp. SAG-AH-194-I05]